MKSYAFGVAWIAANDEPSDLDEDSVSYMISVALLADLAGKTQEEVAKHVVALRRAST